jgi:hypothetical protein
MSRRELPVDDDPSILEDVSGSDRLPEWRELARRLVAECPTEICAQRTRPSVPRIVAGVREVLLQTWLADHVADDRPGALSDVRLQLLPLTLLVPDLHGL